METEELKESEVWAIIQENVNRGADYLDKTLPNWYRNIDLEELDMYKSNYCICGQLNKRYHTDLDDLNEEFGFYLPSVGKYEGYVSFNKDREEGWEKLGELWEEQIISRREFVNAKF